MRGSEEPRPSGHQILELFGADLGGTASESTVPWQKIG
jgi:hypothetical protein